MRDVIIALAVIAVAIFGYRLIVWLESFIKKQYRRRHVHPSTSDRGVMIFEQSIPLQKEQCG